MEALKLKAIPVDGKLTVAVPSSLNNSEVEVIVLSEKEQEFDDADHKERVKAMLSIIGTAKDWNKTFDKHEVYDQ